MMEKEGKGKKGKGSQDKERKIGTYLELYKEIQHRPWNGRKDNRRERERGKAGEKYDGKGKALIRKAREEEKGRQREKKGNDLLSNMYTVLRTAKAVAGHSMHPSGVKQDAQYNKFIMLYIIK